MSDFLESIIKRDPAARSKISVILTYPGVKSVFFHRIGAAARVGAAALFIDVDVSFSNTAILLHRCRRQPGPYGTDNMCNRSVWGSQCVFFSVA